MGHQIIKQPPGMYANPYYAVFSSFSDQWIVWNVTREELLDYYAKKAAEDARRHTAEIIDAVNEDPRKAYYQFAMSFEEANAESVERGGPDLTRPGAEEESRSQPDDGVIDPRLPLAGSRDAEEIRLLGKAYREDGNGG